MPEQLLTILQICLLVLIYLFLARVVRAVWVEIGGSPRQDRRAAKTANDGPKHPEAQTAATATALAGRLVFVEPADRRGHTVALAAVTTIGRAAGCTVIIDDHYLSQHHARIRLGVDACTIEDLGSTNGTYVNGARLSGPSTLAVGDHIQLGDTILEVA